MIINPYTFGGAAPPAPSFGALARLGSFSAGSVAQANITLPAGNAGDYYLVALRTGATSTDHTLTAGAVAAGWTELATRSSTGRSTLFALAAAAAVSGALDVDFGAARWWAATAYRVGGVDPAKVVAAFTDITSLDPPEVTPGWGSQLNLAIAGATTRVGNYTVDTLPSGYGELVMAQTGGAFTSDAMVATSEKQGTFGTEDPSTYVFSGSNSGAAFTVILGAQL